MLRHNLIAALVLAAAAAPATAQPGGAPLNKKETLFCASIHYTLLKLPELQGDAAGIKRNEARIGLLLDKASAFDKAAGVSSDGNNETAATTWLGLRDNLDKQPDPAARAKFIGQLKSAADECLERAR
ncbi:MAG: hypothetical protein Q7T61_18975 [Caulobacter sp.]|nr:hypothetical protein [Caulobacter sp.]